MLNLSEEQSSSVQKQKGMKARKGKVASEQLLNILKKLSSMVSAGLPLLEALGMVRDQANSPAMLYVLDDIYGFVERGHTASEAFSRHPEVFDTVFVNLIHAGETSGRFDFFLQRLVETLEKRIHVRKSIKKAMFYPAILMTVAISVVSIMLIKVVPVFVDMYQGMGGELPAITQTVVAISDWLRSGTGGGLTSLLLVGGILLLRFLYRKRPMVRRALQGMLLHVPLIGAMMMRSSMSKIALVLGNLHVAGVSIVESLEITRESISNLLIQEAVEGMREGVITGRSLSAMAAAQPIFPVEFSQLMAVGEKTGKLGEMLEGMEKYYQDEFDNSVQNMTAMIEPLMIVFLGVVIGGILMAMYMPIFNMGQMMQ